jgi:LysR family glycine cleavage system transcriptional activator
VLTPLGRRYYQKIERELAALEDAGRDIANASAPEVLTIHTPPSIASKWLLPLLQELINAHPGIEVRLSAETARAGLSWDAIDLAILYADAPGTEAHSAPLLEELIQPLCSPTILRHRPIRSPADVLAHTLIHTSYNALTWKHWFDAQGVSGYRRHRGIQIDPSHIALEAAAKDFGIVLESDVLAQDEIASGRLVAPLPGSAVRRASYALAWSPDRTLSPAVALCRDWLLDAADRRRPEPSTPAA